jgi:hypothetical protein
VLHGLLSRATEGWSRAVMLPRRKGEPA